MNLDYKKKIFIGLSALTLSSGVFANELYVSTSGNGAQCSSAAPCASIQTAVNTALAGDTIHIGKGDFHENITIPAGKAGLTILGKGAKKTVIISAGGDLNPKFAPPGVPVDIIFDVFSPDVTIAKLATIHPDTHATKRDLGVFVRPPANNTTITECKIQRERIGSNLEPFTPASRGILVLRATGTLITKNKLEGNYEDHLHIASSQTTMIKNKIEGATRLGVVIIQETPESDSTGNIISKNKIEKSGLDGIQVQGDNNIITKNKLENNGAAGIRLCGAGGCVAPGFTAVASGNTVLRNKFEHNVAGGLVDNGTNNAIK